MNNLFVARLKQPHPKHLALLQCVSNTTRTYFAVTSTLQNTSRVVVHLQKNLNPQLSIEMELISRKPLVILVTAPTSSAMAASDHRLSMDYSFNNSPLIFLIDYLVIDVSNFLLAGFLSTCLSIKITFICELQTCINVKGEFAFYFLCLTAKCVRL